MEKFFEYKYVVVLFSTFVPKFLIILIMCLVKYAWDTRRPSEHKLYAKVAQKSLHKFVFECCKWEVYMSSVSWYPLMLSMVVMCITTEVWIMYNIDLPIQTAVTMGNIFFIRVLHTQTMAAMTSYMSELAHPLWGSVLPHHSSLKEHSCTLYLAGEFVPNWQFSSMFVSQAIVVT
jgi:hypothetical protein